MKPVSPTNTFLPLRQQPSCQAFSRLFLAEQAAPAAPDLLLAVPTVCARHSRDPCQRCKNSGARALHANEEKPSASPCALGPLADATDTEQRGQEHPRQAAQRALDPHTA